MAKVTLENLRKSYNHLRVIRDLNLEIADGEFAVFVGPSGCGKSTLLRMIAGLESVSGGEIYIGDQPMNQVAASKRGVAMVFQSYALYPHMNVYDNMAFGLRQAKLPKDEVQQRVRTASEILQISAYLDRYPRALSGGQRQRVAIGRAIVREPRVFLFDEPLSNLDAALRVHTRLEIARLHQRLRTTMIYVTHDQVEAMTLADKIVVLRDGRIEQVGSPMDLYQRPANTFVAGFIGSPKMNFIPTDALSPSAAKKLKISASAEITLGVRPEHLIRCEAENALFTAQLELVENLGEYALVHLLDQTHHELIAKMPHPPGEEKGARLHFTVAPEHVHQFSQADGLRRE